MNMRGTKNEKDMRYKDVPFALPLQICGSKNMRRHYKYEGGKV